MEEPNQTKRTIHLSLNAPEAVTICVLIIAVAAVLIVGFLTGGIR